MNTLYQPKFICITCLEDRLHTYTNNQTTHDTLFKDKQTGFG